MNIFESLTGKDFVILILVICVIALFVLTPNGDRLVKIQPIRYMQAVYENLPEKPMVLALATKDAEALAAKNPGELIGFLFTTPIQAILAPTMGITEMAWYGLGVAFTFVNYLPELLLFESEARMEEVKT